MIKEKLTVTHEEGQILWEISVCKGVCAQSYLALCDPMDCSQPGASVHGILQTKLLEWVACPPQGIFPTQGSNPHPLSPASQVDSSLPSHQGSLRCLYIHYCFGFFFTFYFFIFFSQVLSFIIIIINWSPSISIFFVWWLANCKIIIVILYIYIFTIIWQMLTPFKAQLDVPTVWSLSWVLQEGESRWEGREKARLRTQNKSINENHRDTIVMISHWPGVRRPQLTYFFP